MRPNLDLVVIKILKVTQIVSSTFKLGYRIQVEEVTHPYSMAHTLILAARTYMTRFPYPAIPGVTCKHIEINAVPQ